MTEKDAAKIFHTGYERNIANIIYSSKNATNISNYDERILQKELINKIKSKPDILILGSSRTMLINSSYFESSASITEDESYIYFVSERPTGNGQTDIYYVKKTDHSYSEPIHLENNINTAGDEKCVFIHPNGKVLYFSSTGHNTMGGYDIFYTYLNSDGWDEPMNVGYPVNSIDDDKS